MDSSKSIGIQPHVNGVAMAAGLTLLLGVIVVTAAPTGPTLYAMLGVIGVLVCICVWLASRLVFRATFGESLFLRTLLGERRIEWEDVAGMEPHFGDRTPELMSLGGVGAVLWLLTDNAVLDFTIELNDARHITGRINSSSLPVIAELFEERPHLHMRLARSLRSPRATIRTFVEATDESDLSSASECLNIEASNDIESLHQMASEFRTAINEIGAFDFEDISDEPATESPYTPPLYPDPTSSRATTDHPVRLVRAEQSGFWRLSVLNK